MAGDDARKMVVGGGSWSALVLREVEALAVLMRRLGVRRVKTVDLEIEMAPPTAPTFVAEAAAPAPAPAYCECGHQEHEHGGAVVACLHGCERCAAPRASA